MTEKDFDAYFRAAFAHSEAEVPADMWDRINGKKKRRVIFFIPRWYFFSLLLIVAVAVGGLFMLKEPTVAVVPLSVVDSLRKMDNAIGKTIPETITKRPDSSDAEKAYTGEVRNGKDGPVNEPSLKKYKALQDAIKRKDNDDGLPKESKDSVGVKTTGKKPQEIAQPYAPAPAEKTSPVVAMLPDSTSKTDLTSSDESDSVTAGQMMPDDVTKFSVEFFVSPDLPFNSFSSDHPVYAQLLENSAGMQFSWSMGARLNFNIGKRLVAKAGVHYAVVNEAYTLSSDSILTGGNMHSRYKSIDVPFILGYKLGSGKLLTAINAGVLLNIASKYSGVIPGIDGSGTAIGSGNVYKGNTGVSLYLSTSVSKKINDRFTVFAEPYFRSRLSYITTSMQMFDQKIHSAGLITGFKYHLFRNDE